MVMDGPQATMGQICSGPCAVCAQLVDAAPSAVAAHGTAASIDVLAQGASVAPAVARDHLRDGVTGVVAVALERVMRALTAEWRQAFEGTKTFEAGLWASLSRLAEVITSRPDHAYLCFVAPGNGDHALVKRQQQHRAELVALLAERGVALQGPPEPPPASLQLELLVGALFHRLGRLVDDAAFPERSAQRVAAELHATAAAFGFGPPPVEPEAPRPFRAVSRCDAGDHRPPGPVPV